MRKKIEDYKYIIIISLVLSLLICCATVFFDYDKTNINIQYISSENDSADRQIFISRIVANDMDISLFDIELSKGWEYDLEFDDIYTVGGDIEGLDINIPEAEYVFVYFAYTDPSVCEIVDGDKSIFLSEKFIETNNPDVIRYKVKSNIKNYLVKAPLVALSIFVSYFVVIFALLYFAKRNKRLFALPLIFIFYISFIKNPYIRFDSSMKIAIFVVIVASGVFLKDIIDSKRFEVYKTKKSFIIILISSLYFNFSLVGHDLFMTRQLFVMNIMNFSIFILTWILFFISTAVFLYTIDYIIMKITNIKKEEQKSRNTYKKTKTPLFIKYFILNFSIIFLISLIFYPSNFTPDGGQQVLQAVGILPIANDHPAIHTIFLRLSMLGTKNPFLVIVAHNIIWSTLIAKFCVFLSKKGIPNIFLIIFSIIMCLSPNNFLMLTLMSKNILFGLMMLWLVYLTMVALEDPVKYFSNILNIILYSLCISLICTVRHNGLFIIFAFAILLIRVLYLNKENINLKPVLTLFFVFFFVFLIQNPIYKIFGVKNTNNADISASGQTPLIQAFASAYVNDVKLDNSTIEYLDTIVDFDDFYKNRGGIHRSFFSIGIDHDRAVLSETFKHYIKLLLKHPTIPFKNRLNLTDSTWNIVTPKNSGYIRYTVGMLAAASRTAELEEIIGTEYNTDILEFYINKSESIKYTEKIVEDMSSIELLDAIMWRSGLCLSISILFLAHSIINKKYDYIFIWLYPFLIIISLLLSICWHIFQYSWFFQICFIFLAIYYLVSYSHINKNEQ